MNMQDDNQKIYLYNRRLFTTDSSHIPKEIRLKPFEIPTPLFSGSLPSVHLLLLPLILLVPTDIPISVALEGSHSAALRSLVLHEKTYLTQLRR